MNWLGLPGSRWVGRPGRQGEEVQDRVYIVLTLTLLPEGHHVLTLLQILQTKGSSPRKSVCLSLQLFGTLEIFGI